MQKTLPRKNAIALFISRVQLNLYMHSFSIRTTHNWNAWSDDVVRVALYIALCAVYITVLKSFVRGKVLM